MSEVAKAKQEPRKHHFLPEFYTGAWCVNGKLIRYVNRRGRVHTRSFAPGGVGYRNDLYRLLSANVADRTQIETHHFEQIDNAAAPVFARMNRDGRVMLSDGDREAVAKFILSLPARNPWGLEIGQKISHETYGTHLSDESDARALLLAPNRTIWQQIVGENPHFVADSTLIQMIEVSTDPAKIDRLGRMFWNIWDVSESNFDLVLGDQAFSGNGNLNVDDPKNVFAIPVGPKRFLTCSGTQYHALKPREMATHVHFVVL
jgi:hypothetical protein